MWEIHTFIRCGCLLLLLPLASFVGCGYMDRQIEAALQEVPEEYRDYERAHIKRQMSPQNMILSNIPGYEYIAHNQEIGRFEEYERQRGLGGK